MGRRQQRRQTRSLEVRLAAKCAEVEQLKAQLEELRAQLTTACAEANAPSGPHGIEDAPGVPRPHVLQVRKGFAGSVVVPCEVHCKTPSVKAILDSYAAQERMPPKLRSLLKLVKGKGDLDECQCVDVADTLELFVVQIVEPTVGLAVEFRTSGHEDGITLAELRMFNSRAGVVIRVEKDICPDANTEIDLGSEVSLVLRGTGMCLKVFEIMKKDQADALKKVLNWSSAHQDWTTTDGIAMGNWEDCGCSDMPLPAGSTLRGHRPKDEQYGMVQPFCLDHVRLGTVFLFQCSPLEVAMNDLNVKRNECCKKRIDIEGFTINEALVPYPRPLGIALTTGDVIPPRSDALDIRSNTGLNVLAVQPAAGPLEWAPSSETLISKGCRLFFLQGHMKKVEATKLDGKITLDHVPFFQ